jgi:two-component system, NarL family, sensor histidine kinase UhpB
MVKNTKLKIQLFFLVFLFCIKDLQSQNPGGKESFFKTIHSSANDTDKVYAMFKYGETFEQGNKDSAIYWYHKGQQLANKINYINGQLRYRHYIGIFYWSLNKYDSALAHADTAYKLAVKYNRKGFQVTSLNLQGTVYQYKSQMQKAAKYYVRAYEMAEQIKDTAFMNAIAGNLSGVFIEIKRYVKARYYAQIAYDLSVATKDTLSEGYNLINLATSEINDKEYELAIKESNEAFKIGEIFGDKLLQLYALSNIASSNYELGNTGSAIKSYTQMEVLSRASESNYHLLYALQGLGNCLGKVNNLIDAIKKYNEAISLSKTIDNKTKEYELRKSLSLAYEKSGNLKEALIQLNLTDALRDSINVIEQNKNVSEIEENYQNEKKLKEIAEKNLELKTEKEKSNRRLLGLIISAISIGILIYLFLQRRKLELQKRAVLQKETELKIYKSNMDERSRLAANLHDDIGSTLSSISIYSEAAKNNIHQKNNEKVIELVNKIGENARETMTHMSDIVWAINPLNDNGTRLFNKMESFASSILSSKNIELQFTVANELNAINFEMPVRQNLFLLFKEAINNCAKYSKAKNVSASFSKANDNIFLEIKDNGIGFDMNGTQEGNGLRNIHSRAKELSGNITIESSEKGTNLKLIFRTKGF